MTRDQSIALAVCTLFLASMFGCGGGIARSAAKSAARKAFKPTVRTSIKLPKRPLTRPRPLPNDRFAARNRNLTRPGSDQPPTSRTESGLGSVGETIITNGGEQLFGPDDDRR